ncbi:Hmgcs1 [Symbiodinium sp. CCMP2592]|nr:Hmgcs1 [Symbiodinium sp. CCMP2592]
MPCRLRRALSAISALAAGAVALATPPAWWLRSHVRREEQFSISELELMAQLGVLLMPDHPIEELFRRFEGSGRFRRAGLLPDLVAFGVLKEPEAALFVEYDGHWSHTRSRGYRKDKEKNAALLALSPPGSWVIRIGHFNRRPMGGRNSMYVKVNEWQGDEDQCLTMTLGEVVRRMLSDLRAELDPALHLRLLRHQASNALSAKAKEFAAAAARDSRIRAGLPREAETAEGDQKPPRCYSNI